MLQGDDSLESFVLEYFEVGLGQVVYKFSFIVEHSAVQDDFFSVDVQSIPAGGVWRRLLALRGGRSECHPWFELRRERLRRGTACARADGVEIEDDNCESCRHSGRPLHRSSPGAVVGMGSEVLLPKPISMIVSF